MNFHAVVVFVTNHTTLFKVGLSVLWGVQLIAYLLFCRGKKWQALVKYARTPLQSSEIDAYSHEVKAAQIRVTIAVEANSDFLQR